MQSEECNDAGTEGKLKDLGQDSHGRGLGRNYERREDDGGEGGAEDTNHLEEDCGYAGDSWLKGSCVPILG